MRLAAAAAAAPPPRLTSMPTSTLPKGRETDPLVHGSVWQRPPDVCFRGPHKVVIFRFIEQGVQAPPVGHRRLPRDVGDAWLPRDVGGAWLPLGVGDAWLPRDVGGAWLPRDVGDAWLPRDVGDAWLPRDVGARCPVPGARCPGGGRAGRVPRGGLGLGSAVGARWERGGSAVGARWERGGMKSGLYCTGQVTHGTARQTRHTQTHSNSLGLTRTRCEPQVRGAYSSSSDSAPAAFLPLEARLACSARSSTW